MTYITKCLIALIMIETVLCFDCNLFPILNKLFNKNKIRYNKKPNTNYLKDKLYFDKKAEKIVGKKK